MNINLKLNINNLERYYPYIGIFTNNPNDIRGLQFLYYYSNNKYSEYTSIIGGKKYLKYEYYNLFKDAFQHLLNLRKYLNNKKEYNDYYLRKWYFDFIYSGVKLDDNELFNFPSIYPEKEIYDDVFPRYEIINKITDPDLKEDELQELKNDVLQFDFLDIFDGQEIIMITLVEIYEDRLNNYLSDFNGYINESNNKIDDPPLNSLKPTVPSSLDKKFIIKIIGKFNSNIIKNINELLDFKYLRLAQLKKIQLKRWDEFIPIQTDNCYKTYLNLENEECNNTLNEVLFKEKDYGQESKDFFRNHEYFKIFNEHHKENIIVHSSFINQLILEKLKFKTKGIKFFINNNIYDYFIEKDYIKIINIEKNKLQVELPSEIVNDLKENDKLIFFYINRKVNVPCKIINIKNTTITVILNKKVFNNTDLFNYDDKDEDYTIDENYPDELNNLSDSDIVTPHYIGFNKILIQRGEIYLKYYESTNSWKNNQTIDKKLNENKNLLEFLKYCVEVINRKIIYLNPKFRQLYEGKNYMTSNIIELIIDLNIKLNNEKKKLKRLLELPKPLNYKESSYSEIYNKISNLLDDKEIDNEEVLDVIRSNSILDSNYLQELVEFNFLNKVQLLNLYFSNPNKKNLNTLLSILNLLTKFNKNINKI